MLLGNLLPLKLKKIRWFRASLVEWNKAAMLKHIWVLAAKSPYIDYRYVFYIQCFFFFISILLVYLTTNQIMVAGFLGNFYR